MPAIQVARTDTFEQQRVKINDIGSQLFSITQGGSDLATGNLKIGDGIRTSPSLAFASDSSLGIYKSDQKTIGYVSDGKKILDISLSNISSYKNLIFQKRFLQSSGISIFDSGSNYDPGSYQDISLTGGSGSDAKANITVQSFIGDITNNGSNYNVGSYSNVELLGGSGNGAIASFSVDGILGTITNSGSGYFPGNYQGVPLETDGVGFGALADIFIQDGLTPSSISGSIVPGSGYVDGLYSSVPLYNTPTTTYAVTSVSNPNTPPPSFVYQIDGITQQTLNLLKGNTYRFDISDASMVGHPLIFETGDGNPLSSLYYVVVTNGSPGVPGSFVDLIIKPSAPTETIRYDCSSHDGMGSTISIASGTIGSHGSGAIVNVTISGNIVTDISFVTIGTGYKQNDVLEVLTSDIGSSGSGFSYTITSVNLTGSVSGFFVTSIGQDYQNLDNLSFSNLYVGGNGSGFQYSISSNPGTIQSIQFVSSEPGYIIGDILSLPLPVTGIATTLDSGSNSIVVPSVSGISQGYNVVQTSGTGDLGDNITVLSINSQTNSITLSSNPVLSGSAILTFSPGFGSGTDQFEFTISDVGVVSSVTIVDGGNGYFINDVLSVSPLNLAQPIVYSVLSRDVQIISFDTTVPDSEFSTSDTITIGVSTANIYEIVSSSGNIDFLIVDNILLQSGDTVTKTGTSSTYTLDSVEDQSRYFIDTSGTYNYTPNLVLYSGNTYNFDISDISNQTHLFSFSRNPDGIHYSVLGLTSTLDISSPVISVASTAGLYPGMSVSVSSGSGQVQFGTSILSVDNSTTLTLTNTPLVSGESVLDFFGSEYTDGVSRVGNTVILKVTDNTPALYYYCGSSGSIHENEGGQSSILIDLNNPRIFGSGLQISVNSVDTSDTIVADVETGEIQLSTITADSSVFNDIIINSSLVSPDIDCINLDVTNISSQSLLSISSPSISFFGDISFGSSVSLSSSSGNITTSGFLKTTNSVNINDKIIITDNNIASTTNNNILLSPSSGRVAKVNATSALTIPSGTTAQRPAVGIVENGSIRFNTETGQYEGYSAATSSWSSLGGVRDLDGNTYIAAEASIGANDNTLYFFNDGNNTVSVTPNYLQFVNAKKIRSVNTTVPAYTDYTTNTPVTIGDYLKYRNNIYEITISGTTGTSGNEPTHTTGAATNGTAELTWYASAVAPLTFEEVEEVRIDPLGFTNLVVNNELRFSNNVISTDLNDLIVRPNSGKKVTIDAESSLVIPVGDSNQRGVAAQGSIRYNTDISQYEGYDGSNWTSLGGVKDVDGNTYIIPETAPGSNENILYFYNDGINTMRLSTNSLEFTNIDAITTQNNNLDIEASSVTFNSLAATIDTSGTSTFISTTKDNLDLGLAVGLNVDPLLRLDINGDIYLNKAFGTGSFDGIKLFNSDLSTLELSDLAISSNDISLIKGGTNSGASVLYDPSRDSGAKVTVSIVNQTTGDKEMIEYQVIDKGSDIYHTEIGNLNTGVNLVSSVFDFDANNNVRVTFTLTDLTVGDVVNITVVKHIFKK